jgi:hypothetical protein
MLAARAAVRGMTNDWEPSLEGTMDERRTTMDEQISLDSLLVVRRSSSVVRREQRIKQTDNPSTKERHFKWKPK